MKTTFYHGASHETVNPTYLYFSKDIEDARSFALGLDDLGNYFDHSYIYKTEIDLDDADIEDDFDAFDCLAYYTKLEKPVYNPKTGWIIIPNPALTLIEDYDNVL